MARQQPELDPQSLVIIGEGEISTKFAHLAVERGKASGCYAAIPHGHWKTVTFLGGLTPAGVIAQMRRTHDGKVSRDWCKQLLAPDLRPGNIVMESRRP